MDIIFYFIDFFINLDKHLSMIIASFGIWAYVIPAELQAHKFDNTTFINLKLTTVPVLLAIKLHFAYKIAIRYNPPERMAECTI